MTFNRFHPVSPFTTLHRFRHNTWPFLSFLAIPAAPYGKLFITQLHVHTCQVYVVVRFHILWAYLPGLYDQLWFQLNTSIRHKRMNQTIQNLAF